MNWIKVFDADILQANDFVKAMLVNGKKLCIIKVGSSFYATQTKCPHAGADLSQGWCKAGKLVCPFHRHEFDLETGRGELGQGDYINVYPVENRKDGIYVGLKSNQNWLLKLFGK